MYSKSKRFIASFLAVLMAVCMLPADMLGGVGVAYAYGTAEIEAGNITLSGAVTKGEDGAYTAEYTGEAIEPTVTLADVGDKTPQRDVDYAVSCTGNTDVGEATVTVTAKDTDIFAEDSSDSVKFTITKAAIKEVKLAADSVTAGSEAPTPTVKTAAQTLTAADYDLAYTNKDGGATVVPTAATAGTTVVVTATAKGDSANYTGSASAEYIVTEAAPTKVDLTAAMITVGDAVVKGTGTETDPYVADGLSVELNETVTAATPAVVVKLKASDETPVAASEYTATYAGNTAKGTATVTVKPADNSTVFNASETGIVIQFTVTEKEGGDEDDLYYDVDLSAEIAQGTTAAGGSLTFMDKFGTKSISGGSVTVEGVSYTTAVQGTNNPPNGTDIPEDGKAAIKLEAAHDGILTATTKDASGKSGYFVTAKDGTMVSKVDLDEMGVSKIRKFDVKEGYTYYLFVTGSKIFLYSLSVDYRPLTSETMTAPEVVSAEVNSDKNKFTVTAKGIVGVDGTSKKRYADSLKVTMEAPDGTKTSQKISVPNTSFADAETRTFEFALKDATYADGNYKFTASLVRSNEATETVGTVTKTVTIGEPNTWTIKFMDGTTELTAKEKTVTKGEKYTFTDADKLDDTATKKFKGWAATNDAEATVITEITPTEDTSVYAVWADLYTVTLENGTETYTGFPATVEAGEKVKLPAIADTATEKFTGWKEKGATGDNVPTYTGEYTVTKTVILVPVFVDANSVFTVTRDYGYKETGSDTNKTDTITVTKGADGKATVTLTDLTTPTGNEGHTFDKWVVYENGAEGAAVTAEAGVEIDKDTTFLAKWTKNPDMYTVAFKDADGNTVTTTPTIDAQVPENTEITLPATTNTKDDYDFEGWKVNGEGSVLSVGATYKVEGNVTFVESWKAKEGPDTPPTPSDIPKDKALYVRFVDADGDEVDPDDEYIYTGAKVEPKVEVYNYGRLLTVGTDYTVKYKNNVNAGTNASLTVSGKGNFSGAANVITFTIKPASIASVAYPESMTVAVNAKVAPAIMHGTKKLGNNKDFTLEGDGLDAKGKYATAGDYTLTVKGKGNYAESSSATIDVKVVEKSAVKKLNVKVDTKTKLNYGEFSVEDISELVVKPAANSGEDEAATQADADESGVTPIITVSDKSGTVLTEDKDFVIYTASSLNDAGTVKFTVVGMGEYSGTVNKSFKINPAKITSSGKFKVEFDNKDYEFKASGVTVDNLTVKYLGDAATQAEGDEGVLLTEGVDYKVAYSNNKKVSVGEKQAQIKINFLGNYKGSKVDPVKFNIVTAKLDAGEDGNTVVVVPEKVYGKDGKAYKSTPIVMVDGVAIKASNYTVHYAWRAESAATYTEDDKVKITLGAEDTYAHVKVTIEPKANASYAAATVDDKAVAIEGGYYVVKQDEKAIDLSKAKVVFTDKSGNVKKALDYNGKPFYTPDADGTDAHDDEEADDPNAVYVKVTVKNVEVSSELYSVEWTNATEKGKATVVVTGTWEKDDAGNSAVGSKNASISIKPMKIAKTALPSNKKPVVAGAFKDALDKLF